MDLEEEILLEYKALVKGKFIMTEHIQKAVRNFAKAISNESPYGVVLSGKTGTGKTKLMLAAFKVFNNHNTVNMEYLPSSKIPTITKNSEGYSSVIDYRMPFLAIDDFGSEPERILDYGTELNPFQDIIQYRYDMKDKRKILFATTNLSPNLIKERYGDRVLSRLYEENLFILIDSKDFRYVKK